MLAYRLPRQELACVAGPSRLGLAHKVASIRRAHSHSYDSASHPPRPQHRKESDQAETSPPSSSASSTLFRQKAKTGYPSQHRKAHQHVSSRILESPSHLAWPDSTPGTQLNRTSQSLENLQRKIADAEWPFSSPKPEHLYRDAYIAQPDRFDWRKRPDSCSRRELPMQRRRASASMLQGQESKVAAKARRTLEKSMDDRSLRMSKDKTLELLSRNAERAAIRQEAKLYRARWTEMLDHERKQELDTIKERRKTPIDKLIEEGIAIDGLQAYWQDDSRRHFGKRVAVFKLSAAQGLPRNLFRAGDKVTIMPSRSPSDETDVASDRPTTSADLDDDAIIEAEVVEKQKSYLRLKFDEEDENLDLVACSSWRLDYGFNDLTFERVKIALDALDHDVEFVETKYGSKFQYILSGTRLNDIILGVEAPSDRVTRGAFWEDARMQSWYDRFSRTDPILIDGDPTPPLNASQTRAVAMMLRERISLIQGPPGTGKTRTIVTAIKLLKDDFQVPHPVMLAAHTNVAVDNLAEGCIDAGLKVVRIGPSARARAGIDKYTLDAYFLRHPAKPRLDDIKRSLDALEKIKSDLELKGFSSSSTPLVTTDTSKGGISQTSAGAAVSWEEILAEDERSEADHIDTAEEYEAIKKQLSKLKGRYFFLRASIRGDILSQADVICGSAIAAGSPELDMIDLPIVFFDEASMATEPVSLVPLMKGCRHLSIIGDHKQLPPVVTSQEAKEKGLSRSLFQRLIESGDERIKSTMLNVQFRMHPTLAHFPNETFYGGALENGEGTDRIEPVTCRFLCRNDTDSLTSAVSSTNDAQNHLSFINHKGRESKADNHSLRNHSEAQIAFDVIIDLLVQNPDLKGSDIGIVTPYVGQQILLEKMLHNELSGERKRAASFFRTQAKGGESRSYELGSIDIHTVDGFEGREKKVILFSTVRTNPQGYVGFLADGRRLNVALTRAKSALFVIGNIETFKNAQLSEAAMARVDSPDLEALRKYADFIERNQLLLELDAQPSDDYEAEDVELRKLEESDEEASLHWQHVREEQQAL